MNDEFKAEFKVEILNKIEELDTRLDGLNARLVEISGYLDTLHHMVCSIRTEMEINK